VDELARQFLNRYQGGFPIAEQPFVDIAEALETDVETLIDSIRQLLEDGTSSTSPKRSRPMSKR
jgi:DNA-binding Lrp family transcriptional regulator